MKYYCIEEDLYQGGMPDDHLPIVIQGIVSLTREQPPIKRTILSHIWLPITDDVFPGIEWLNIGVKFIEVMNASKMSVYVHCRAGISRSSLLTTAYLMKKHRTNMTDTLTKIRKINPNADPNMRFIEGLKSWQKYLGIEK